MGSVTTTLDKDVIFLDVWFFDWANRPPQVETLHYTRVCLAVCPSARFSILLYLRNSYSSF
jgi:hypothetical protein